MSPSLLAELPASQPVNAGKLSKPGPDSEPRGTREVRGESAPHPSKAADFSFRASMLECNRMVRRSPQVIREPILILLKIDGRQQHPLREVPLAGQ